MAILLCLFTHTKPPPICVLQWPCTFLAAVRTSASYASGFQILATLYSESERDGSLPLLLEGMEETGTVSSDHFRYYRLEIGPGRQTHSEVTITVTGLSGNVDLYVSREVDTAACVGRGLDTCDIVQRPTVKKKGGWWVAPLVDAKTYTWSSTYSSSLERVRITQDDAHFCTGCTYIVGVLGRAHNANSTFALMAKSGSSLAPIVLRDAVPIEDSVEKGKYEYFVYTVTEDFGDLLIGLDALSGTDPDLYVYGHSLVKMLLLITWCLCVVSATDA